MEIILNDGSIAVISDTGYVKFYPNFKYWKKTRKKGMYASFYEWYFPTKEMAIGVIKEINMLYGSN